MSVSFSPDGQTLASGSADGSIRIWDVADGSPLCVLKGHDSSVNSVSYSPDGQTLASGSGDMTIRLWNVGTAGGSPPEGSPASTATESIKANDVELGPLLDRLARGEATAISVFSSSGEANARAQAKFFSAWAARAGCGLGVFLLRAAASTENKQFLLVKVGTRDAQWKLTNARKLADFDQLQSEVLAADERGAISPAVCYENFPQPCCWHQRHS